MGLSGVSGPFSGAYQTWNLFLGTLPAATNSHPVWAYTVPAGLDITIFNVQAYAKQGGFNATMNVLDDGTSVLSSPVSLASGSSSAGTLTTTTGVSVAAGSSITATAFNDSGAVATDAILTILWAPRGNTHPNSVRTAYE